MEFDRKPFLVEDKLELRGVFTDIHTIENNPNYLAKTYKLDFEQFQDGEYPHNYKKRIEQFIKETGLIKKFFEDMMPEFHVAIAEANWDELDNDGRTPLIFMKKVIRTSERSETDNQKYLDDLDGIYSKEIELFRATFDGNFALVPEIFKSKNFVFGQTNTDDIPKLYFVDLYPVYHWTPQILLSQFQNIFSKYEKEHFVRTKENLNKLEDLIK